MTARDQAVYWLEEAKRCAGTPACGDSALVGIGWALLALTETDEASSVGGER